MSEIYVTGEDHDEWKSEVWGKILEAPVLAVDVETVNTNDYTCIGIGVSTEDGIGLYVPALEAPEYLPELMGVLGDKSRTKIYHNGANFDLLVLDMLAEAEGLTKPDDENYEDTSIMAQVSGHPAGLERLGVEWLGEIGLFSIQDLFEEYGTRDMMSVPEPRVAEKCLNDVRTTMRLYHYLKRRLTDSQWDCYEVDRKLIHVLRQVEKKGLRLRENLVEEHYEKLSAKTLRIRQECEAEGFNPGSPAQSAFVLASRGNILPFTKSKKQLRADEDLLEALDDPLASTILEYRRASKLLSSYIVPWRGKDRAYTHFRLNLATGRLASGRYNNWDRVNRNLQNVPPSMREIFGPDNKVWSWADYSQIELRVLAYMSQDKVMLEEYAKEAPDLHSVTAGAAGISRSAGKTFNFAMVFGASDNHLSKTLGVDIRKVKEIKARWKATFKNANDFMDRQMYQHGEAVETVFGRQCRLPEPMEGADVNLRKFQSHVDKCAINYPIQGTAADIIKRGMLEVWKQGVDLRVQVHDEYLVDGEWEPGESLSRIHPELHTPIETYQSITWS